jgi:psiF repeat-containing protein
MESLMHKFVIALAMTLFASFLVVSPFALAETAQQNKMKDCNEQANTKGPGVGVGIGIGILGIGIGQGKSDERKASMKECPSAKPVKSGKTAQQKK